MIIQQQGREGVIIWNSDDFIGLVDGYGTGNYPKFGKGSSHQTAINPFRETTPGILSPAFTTSSLTNAAQVSGVIRNSAVNRETAQPNAWLIDTASRVHRINGSAGEITKTISITDPFPHNIQMQNVHGAHSTGAAEDIAVFTIVSGGTSSTSVFYSYNDNTDGDVGRVDTTPDGFDEDWYSAQAGESAFSKTYSHPMIVGDDNRLYIGDGGDLRYVTNTGAFGSTSSVVPFGFAVRAFTTTGTHLVIFADRTKGSGAAVTARGDAIALFWNYGSQSADYVYQLNDNEVTCGFNWNNILGCFTTGRPNEFANIGYRSKLQIFENGRFIPKFHFSEAPPELGGADIHNNLLVWQTTGVVYAYGSPYPNLPARVNKIAAGAGTTIGGFCKSLNGSDIYISSGSGTSNETVDNGGTYYASSVWKGLVAEPIFPNRYRGKIDSVEIVYYGSATPGRTVQLTLDIDYGTTTSTVLTGVGTITAGTQVVNYQWDTASNTFPYFSAVKPQVSWSAGTDATNAPKISQIKIYYSIAEITY